jgi:hypothetical protein
MEKSHHSDLVEAVLPLQASLGCREDSNSGEATEAATSIEEIRNEDNMMLKVRWTKRLQCATVGG